MTLATKPNLTGSPATPNTIGMVAVAVLAASPAAPVPGVAMTLTCRRTRSAASSGKRSYWPSAQRNSIATFRPSTKPVSPRPCRNAVTTQPRSPADAASRNPITGIGCCCERAPSGHAAAAPPSSVMKSRRLIPIMGTFSPAQYQRAWRPRARFAALSACHKRRQKVLGRPEFF